jgi:enoyl-CoA hydratase
MADVNYDREGEVGHLTLNRPQTLNALTPAMLEGVGESLDRFLTDDGAKVLVVRGEGRSFCAGIDVGARSQYGTADAVDDHERLRGMAALWLRFWDSPKPIIAAIQGYCLAGAVQLPLCCDLVVVAEDAVIGAPKLPIGGGWIGPMLAHRVGVQRAKLFALRLGYEMSGREAYELGFAAVTAPADRLADVTEALARDVARMPADLLRIEKLSINAAADATGFRAAVLNGTLWDAVAHTTQGVAQARALVRSEGIKAAIAAYVAPTDEKE